MDNLVKRFKLIKAQLFNTGTWSSSYDAMLYIAAVTFIITLVFDTIAGLILNKVAGFKLTAFVWKMQPLQLSIFLFIVAHIIFTTIVVTYYVLNLYDKIINRPVQELKEELKNRSQHEISDYILKGKLSKPFKDPESTDTWQDIVLNFVDAATSEKYVDHLTGCFNKNYYTQKFLKLMNSNNLVRGLDKNLISTYSTEVYSVFMVDIDHFKRVNDDFGHAAGDEVLSKVGSLLREITGDMGVVIRNGGEEFLIFCVAKYPYNFTAFAEKINEEFRKNISVRSPIDNTVRKITCSVGMVKYPYTIGGDTELTFEEHVALADMAMYMAKTNGRDRWYELVCDKNPMGKIDKYKYCSDPEYGLKREYYFFQNYEEILTR